MERILTCVLSLGIVVGVFAQTYTNDKLETMRLGSGEILMGRQLDGPEVVGSSYFLEDWTVSDLSTFANKVYQDVRIKYNITHNVVLAFDEEVKREYFLSSSKIRSFSLLGKKFLNIGALHAGLSRETGFVEEVYQGEYLSIYISHFTSTLKPTYKEGLNMGTRDYRLVKRNKPQLFIDKQLLDVPKSRKDFLKLFGQRASEVDKYLKSAKLNYKDGLDLKNLAVYLDTVR